MVYEFMARTYEEDAVPPPRNEAVVWQAVWRDGEAGAEMATPPACLAAKQ